MQPISPYRVSVHYANMAMVILKAYYIKYMVQ